MHVSGYTVVYKFYDKCYFWYPSAFNALNEALSIVPVLGYPNFSREHILKTDASLNGLGTILLQQGKDWRICIIVYASHSFHPSKISMYN